MLKERKKDVHATNSNLLKRFLSFFFGGREGRGEYNDAIKP